jgi:hypothetical protein
VVLRAFPISGPSALPVQLASPERAAAGAGGTQRVPRPAWPPARRCDVCAVLRVGAWHADRAIDAVEQAIWRRSAPFRACAAASLAPLARLTAHGQTAAAATERWLRRRLHAVVPPFADGGNAAAADTGAAATSLPTDTAMLSQVVVQTATDSGGTIGAGAPGARHGRAASVRSSAAADTEVGPPSPSVAETNVSDPRHPPPLPEPLAISRLTRLLSGIGVGPRRWSDPGLMGAAGRSSTPSQRRGSSGAGSALPGDAGTARTCGSAERSDSAGTPSSGSWRGAGGAHAGCESEGTSPVRRPHTVDSSGARRCRRARNANGSSSHRAAGGSSAAEARRATSPSHACFTRRASTRC